MIITNLKEEYIMEDSPNEVQNIPSPTKIEEVDEPKTVEELQKELDLLKAENTKTKRNLMWKVRKLEKDKILTENEKIRLERELKSLRGEVVKIDCKKQYWTKFPH